MRTGEESELRRAYISICIFIPSLPLSASRIDFIFPPLILSSPHLHLHLHLPQLSPFPPFFMDPNRSSPRRQLQGPRPPPLRVSKDSVKIKKPPPHPLPGPSHSTASTDQAPQGFEARRKPVIIYDASPKVIHTKPSDFMSLVQRLTGQGSEAAAGPSATSPAARLAAIEKSVTPSPRPARNPTFDMMDELMDVLQYPIGSDQGFVPHAGQGPGLIGQVPPPGILSPMPSSLPPVSPGFFSPLLFDPSCLTILNDLSPVFNNPATAGNGNNFAGSGSAGNYSSCSSPFTFSPSALLTTPVIPSPGYNSDLFNINMLDF